MFIFAKRKENLFENKFLDSCPYKTFYCLGLEVLVTTGHNSDERIKWINCKQKVLKLMIIITGTKCGWAIVKKSKNVFPT